MNVICWWSGGVTSAVACKVAIDLFGLEHCRMIMIDTRNEDEDTYRFKTDCEKWYGKEIEVIASDVYGTIQDVWHRFNSLNVATGAICSTHMKRRVRERWQKQNEYDWQVFGFEFEKKEFNRALSMRLNHPNSKAIFPLIMMGYDKAECIRIITEASIDIPRMYKYGFKNNNCFNTGCVQGGIGYWQKMKNDFPDKFDKMADLEHKLTAKRGSPVTMLKDQGKEAKDSGNMLVFLRKHPEYPHLKCIDDMPYQKIEPLMECNGFCGVNDLNPQSTTQSQLNFDEI